MYNVCKIDENDQKSEVNIFQGIFDVIMIVFVGWYIPLGPLLNQILWHQPAYYKKPPTLYHLGNSCLFGRFWGIFDIWDTQCQNSGNICWPNI